MKYQHWRELRSVPSGEGVNEIKTQKAGAIALSLLVFLVAFTCIVCADTGVPAVPEVQGITTGTSAVVVGTVTETDSGALTLTNYNPTIINLLRRVFGQDDLIEDEGLGLHTGVLDPGQVQYTAGYNDQYSGVSGQQTFAKSMAVTTANTIADQSNIKANTNVQFIAVDTGRATRTEDLLLDGASQAQDSSTEILCPFANANPGIIPAFCNIEQAGSAFDTTLTSTVTSADTRFIGKDATIPTVLNYRINAQGITLGSQSSPMIGSVSAYLKVHVQESRNESTISLGLDDSDSFILLDPVHPLKSEDLAYSETSTASGLIKSFSKSMSYTSQASAVPIPAFLSID